ncbi:pantoate kinase [Methanobacterium paludis]|uniref:Pantoate kinase n=1 Tax=Methanobacterium paludis (strain DSM 25820 / JCM 18151 / SWAN1) TaxID=868131 RepID=F6D4P3_METPW|nr:pantoate kinase [Methanobacterium paludis]AEG17528.1 GHMP kinase [Methanobacterium paludis]
MKCSVFAPSHITGFFEIIDNPDPLKMGSRGAGVALESGVTTDVKITEGNGIVVKINGKNDPKNASITYKTIDLIKKQFSVDQSIDDKKNLDLKLSNKELDFNKKELGYEKGLNDEISFDGIDKPFFDRKISIEHTVNVPIGAGFGTSAAFALGTSIGIVKALDMPVTYNKAASIAHLAELEMGSGLGDVIAEVCGGIVLRLKEGAPGVGAVDKMILNDSDSENNFFVIAKSLGEIETSSIINDPSYKKKINQTGKDLLFELLKNPYPGFFMKLSRKFSEETQLMNEEVLEVVNVLQDETIGASMAMLGNTAFAISKSPDTSVEGALVSKIDSCGCMFV